MKQHNATIPVHTPSHHPGNNYNNNNAYGGIQEDSCLNFAGPVQNNSSMHSNPGHTNYNYTNTTTNTNTTGSYPNPIKEDFITQKVPGQPHTQPNLDSIDLVEVFSKPHKKTNAPGSCVSHQIYNNNVAGSQHQKKSGKNNNENLGKL